MELNAPEAKIIGGRRISEIDYIKGFCILAMILVHCYESFYAGAGSTANTLFVGVFNIVIGASAFMFCMGFTMDLGREKDARTCLNRGCYIFMAGLFLNIIRYPLVYCITFITDDPNVVFIRMIDVIGVDILSFAGVAFLFMALLKKCKLNPWGIFIVSLVISAIGTLFRYTDTGNPIVNALLGFLIGTNAESYFPLCHWFVFVAAGNLYRVYYTRIENKKSYYAKALPIFAVISAAFIYLAFNHIGPFECLGSETYYYAWMNPIDAIGCIACIITFMGLMWVLSLIVEKIQPKIRPLTYLSENMTILYFLHWIFVMFFLYVLFYGFEVLPWAETDIAIFLYSAVFLVFMIILCELYKKYIREKAMRSVQKYGVVWTISILVIVVAVVILAVTHGLTEIPSFLNYWTIVIDGVPYA